VAEYVERLYADDDMSLSAGRVGHQPPGAGRPAAPRGRRATTGTGQQRRGPAVRVVGVAKGTADGRIYAWYGRDIVDVLDLEIVFEDAPDFTHMMGPTPRTVS
jgi:hypothetical protein